MSLTDVINPIELALPTLVSHVDGPIEGMSFNKQALLFVELSVLAYISEQKAVALGKAMGFTQVSKLGSTSDQSVTVFSNEEDIVISFRGTYDISNFLEDVDYKEVADGSLPGKVHQGFLDDFNKLWPLLTPYIDGKRKVWATGHSMGGALAAIAAVRAARHDGPSLDGLFDFGQPRIGNSAYVSNIYTPSYRWVNHNDLVPRLPTVGMGYAHFGKEQYIDAHGNIVPKTWSGHLKRWAEGLLGILFKYTIADHDIYKYRAAILKANQESDNAKR